MSAAIPILILSAYGFEWEAELLGRAGLHPEVGRDGRDPGARPQAPPARRRCATEGASLDSAAARRRLRSACAGRIARSPRRQCVVVTMSCGCWGWGPSAVAPTGVQLPSDVEDAEAPIPQLAQERHRDVEHRDPLGRAPVGLPVVGVAVEDRRRPERLARRREAGSCRGRGGAPGARPRRSPGWARSASGRSSSARRAGASAASSFRDSFTRLLHERLDRGLAERLEHPPLEPPREALHAGDPRAVRRTPRDRRRAPRSWTRRGSARCPSPPRPRSRGCRAPRRTARARAQNASASVFASSTVP